MNAWIPQAVSSYRWQGLEMVDSFQEQVWRVGSSTPQSRLCQAPSKFACPHWVPPSSTWPRALPAAGGRAQARQARGVTGPLLQLACHWPELSHVPPRPAAGLRNSLYSGAQCPARNRRALITWEKERQMWEGMGSRRATARGRQGEGGRLRLQIAGSVQGSGPHVWPRWVRPVLHCEVLGGGTGKGVVVAENWLSQQTN